MSSFIQVTMLAYGASVFNAALTLAAIAGMSVVFFKMRKQVISSYIFSTRKICMYVC